MKAGIIVYIVGDMPEKMHSDPKTEIMRMKPNVDRVEIVSPCVGHFDVADAWWSLLVKGMQHISCATAEYTDRGELRLTGRTLRLCG